MAETIKKQYLDLEGVKIVKTYIDSQDMNVLNVVEKSETEFKNTLTESLGKKVDKIPDMGLSENSFTTEEKNKLSGIENGAQVNIQADWNEANNSSDSYIKNKPYIYTKNEVDNKFSVLETNIDWKEAVGTYDDIPLTYSNPQDGWTVNVKDTDYTYRYDGEKWVAISANAIPKATQNVDGLLSKEDKINYDDANSQKHTHSNKSILDKITQIFLDNWNAAYTHISDAVKHITSTERTHWNSAYTHSTSAHAPSSAQANVQSDWNETSSTSDAYIKNKPAIPTKTSQLTNDSGFKTTDNNTTYSLSKSGSIIKLTGSDGSSSSVTDDNTTYSNATALTAGLMSSADKAKLDGIATGANNYTYILPTASSSMLGGVKVGYAANGKNYPVALDASGNAYVNVPWTDTNTVYTLPTASSTVLGGVKTGSNITNTSGTLSLTKDNVIAALGYTPPTSDTNTTYSAGTGITLSGNTFSNSGVRSISTGTTNGTISVNTNGTSANVSVYGLKSAAYTESSAYALSTHIHRAINVAGWNTITSKTNDTVTHWGAEGLSAHIFDTDGCVTDQPNRWGYILNIGTGTEVSQLWFTNASGNMAHRGGNASGWSGTWRTILDSVNYTSYFKTTTASTPTHTSYPTNGTNVPTMNFLSFWNGAYNSTGTSNLAYCNKGAFGDMATKTASDYALSTHTHRILKGKSDTRLTNANIASSSDRINSIEYFPATASMSQNKPMADGHILHFNWDTTAGYDSQLYMPNNSSNKMQYRTCEAGTWGVWKTLLDSSNYTNYISDTKNTAGSGIDTTSKLYLIGAPSQSSAGVQTYSNMECYINANKLYSGGYETMVSTINLIASPSASTTTFTSYMRIIVSGTTALYLMWGRAIANSTTNITITFPTSFTYIPTVYITGQYDNIAASNNVAKTEGILRVTSITKTNFIVRDVADGQLSETTKYINWFAIGK